MKTQAHGTTQGGIVHLKDGHGYYETDRYPLGGCFRRNGSTPMKVTITGTFKLCHGCDIEGVTEDGRKVCISSRNIVESEVPALA